MQLDVIPSPFKSLELSGVQHRDPLKLSHFLLEKCIEGGVSLHHPAVAISLQTDGLRNEIASVRIAESRSDIETDIPCTRIIITAGAWSPCVFETLFPTSKFKLPVSSLAGHSLVVRSPHWRREDEGDGNGGCHAVFMASTPGYSPELFSRRGGEIYIAGLNSASEPLPDLATESKDKISSAAIDRLRQTARQVLGRQEGTRHGKGEGDGDSEGDGHDGLEIVRQGLCFRPVTETGLPIIGRIPNEILGDGVNTRPGADGGVYLAAGHGPWGISLSLGTGKVMAEMVQGRELSADVAALGLRV